MIPSIFLTNIIFSIMIVTTIRVVIVITIIFIFSLLVFPVLSYCFLCLHFLVSSSFLLPAFMLVAPSYSLELALFSLFCVSSIDFLVACRNSFAIGSFSLAFAGGCVFRFVCLSD